MNLTFFSNDGQPAYLRPDRVDAITARVGHPEDCMVHLSGGERIAIRGRAPLDMATLLNELLADEADAALSQLRGPQGERGETGPVGAKGEPGSCIHLEVTEAIDLLTLRVHALEQGEPYPRPVVEGDRASYIHRLPNELLIEEMERRGLLASLRSHIEEELGDPSLEQVSTALLLMELERRVKTAAE